jgi:arabinan endo-1,5-alpha-L-arabinosidase
MLQNRLLAAFAALALYGCAGQPLAQSLPPHSNPVLDADFPDPAVIRASDGYYYAYATQTERDGKWVNLQVARSRDLRSWEHLGDALPAKPAWASKTQDFWAPHVQQADGRYFLYYSAKPDAALSDDKRGLCLAVATASSPQGPFTDMGKPLLCGETFVNIDPMTFDDPATGKKLLYWGSGFQPIKVQELAADRMSFAPGSKAIDLIPAVKSEDPNEYQKLVEGAWVVRRGGWYYLFYSGDNCCGPRAHYAVMVARSRSATGPFENAPDKVILEKFGIWNAPGHNSVATDESGTDWMLYHAVDVRQPRAKPTDEPNTRRVMLIDRIEWKEGWPVVRPTPSSQR